MAGDVAADKADLAERFRRGDEDCLDDVLRDLCPEIQRALRRKYHDFIARDEAEHITLAALARAWDCRARYDPARGDLGNWLWTIADHFAANFARSASIRARGLETPTPQARLEQFVDGRCDFADGEGLRGANSRLTKLVRECLAALTPGQRFVLIADANYSHGKAPSAQLSRELGISASAIRMLRRRGLRHFAAELRRRGVEKLLAARYAPSVYIGRGAARGDDARERGTGNDPSIVVLFSQGVGFPVFQVGAYMG